MSDLKVGDKVKALSPCYEEGEDLPPGPCCSEGDLLVVRKVCPDKWVWDYHVSHVGVTDRSFGVKREEVEKL